MTEAVATSRAKPVGKRTQSDFIRESLADRIVHGTLKPGEALDETTIALEFGVSRTPVREALRQLETNGLASSRPHRGAVVASLTARELDEIFVVMAELEALCAQFSASEMSKAQKTALADLHEKGATFVRNGDIEGYTAYNDDFHDAIYAGSHNAFLEQTAIAVRRRLSPFRRMQFEVLDRIRASQVEHGLIVDAILAGDGAPAAGQMRGHILEVRRTVDSVREQ